MSGCWREEGYLCVAHLGGHTSWKGWGGETCLPVGEGTGWVCGVNGREGGERGDWSVVWGRELFGCEREGTSLSVV